MCCDCADETCAVRDMTKPKFKRGRDMPMLDLVKFHCDCVGTRPHLAANGLMQSYIIRHCTHDGDDDIIIPSSTTVVEGKAFNDLSEIDREGFHKELIRLVCDGLEFRTIVGALKSGLKR
jgi:hypothetical protein